MIGFEEIWGLEEQLPFSAAERGFAFSQHFYDTFGFWSFFSWSFFRLFEIARNRSWVSKGIVNGCFEEEIHNLHRGSTEFGAGMMSHSGSSARLSLAFGSGGRGTLVWGPPDENQNRLLKSLGLSGIFILFYSKAAIATSLLAQSTPLFYTHAWLSLGTSSYVLLFPFCPKSTQPKPFPSPCTALPPADDLNSPCNELLHWRADYLLYRWLP